MLTPPLQLIGRILTYHNKQKRLLSFFPSKLTMYVLACFRTIHILKNEFVKKSMIVSLMTFSHFINALYMSKQFGYE